MLTMLWTTRENIVSMCAQNHLYRRLILMVVYRRLLTNRLQGKAAEITPEIYLFKSIITQGNDVMNYTRGCFC